MEYEDWARKGMQEEGLSPEEYCNKHGYNWDDIEKEPKDND